MEPQNLIHDRSCFLWLPQDCGQCKGASILERAASQVPMNLCRRSLVSVLAYSFEGFLQDLISRDDGINYMESVLA